MSRAKGPRLGGMASLSDTTAGLVVTHGVPSTAVDGTLTPRSVPLGDVVPSPFQPEGRPSGPAVEAVRIAIAAAGSLLELVGYPRDDQDDREARHPAYRGLGPEARALADLAADVARPAGITSPLEARPLPDGRWELVSGHRRLAAAALVGLPVVPVVSLGPISDAEAASLVFARNRLRADFSPFHEAQALATLQRLRGGSVRDLAASLGYSHGRAGILLQAARTFDAGTRAELAGGDESRGTSAVATLSYRQLRELVGLARDRPALLVAARRATKLATPNVQAEPTVEGVSTAVDAVPVVQQRRRPGGGVLLTIARSADEVSPADAVEIVAVLERLAKRYRRALREP